MVGVMQQLAYDNNETMTTMGYAGFNDLDGEHSMILTWWRLGPSLR